MTREEARKAAEVMLAYANGEKIEYREYGTNEWCDVDDPCFYWSIGDYRVPFMPKRFDPMTLEPFDRVLVRNEGGRWVCDLFSHFINRESYRFNCVGDSTDRIIPYNDETKHLVGTTDEAPLYYRYWEK